MHNTAIDTVISLIEGYSHVYRKTTQPCVLKDYKKDTDNFIYNPDDIRIRERLIEHVGSLPIIATALYPYINDSSVNLGEALTMLAIHDIGELVTGDEMAFTKKPEDDKKESEAAIGLLHPSYHSLYIVVEGTTTPTGKFAKAIDKIAPDFIDLITPAEITLTRYRHFMNIGADEIIEAIIRYKRPYMLWNSFLTELHVELVRRFSENLKQHTNA
jgi:5'-deoxynucleotidase YfbR-like HD superfamily hydrolase